MKKNKNKKTVKETYIPKFILRNFCLDKKDNIYFYALEDKTIYINNIKDVFNLDESDKDFSIKFLHDFSKYEKEVELLIKNKILQRKKDEEIILSRSEEASLKLYFALVKLRPNITKETSNDFAKVVGCRSIGEVMRINDLSSKFKLDLLQDTSWLSDSYLCFVRMSGTLDLLITDSYPTEIYEIKSKSPRRASIYYPISPRLMMMVVNKNANDIPIYYSQVKVYFKAPIVKGENIVYEVGKAGDFETSCFNQDLFDEAGKGCCFRDMSRASIPSN